MENCEKVSKFVDENSGRSIKSEGNVLIADSMVSLISPVIPVEKFHQL